MLFLVLNILFACYTYAMRIFFFVYAQESICLITFIPNLTLHNFTKRRGIYMKKYRINTTISQKHQAILKKHAEKFGTQQSVLEHSLECFENNLNNQTLELSPEEELWIRIYRELNFGMTILQRDVTKMLFENVDIEKFKEFVKNEKPVEFALEWLYNKPVKELTLQELIDGIIVHTKIQGGIDTTNYTNNLNDYNINITHSMGINWANGLVLGFESLLKRYGTKFECDFSERSIYIKIFK